MLPKTLATLRAHAGNNQVVLDSIIGSLYKDDPRAAVMRDFLKDLFDRLPPEYNRVRDWWITNEQTCVTLKYAPEDRKHFVIFMHWWNPAFGQVKPLVTVNIRNEGILENLDVMDPADRAGLLSVLVTAINR